MDKHEFRSRFINGCRSVISNEQKLTVIDQKFGYGNYGEDMKAVMTKLLFILDRSEGSIEDLLDECSNAILSYGGSEKVEVWHVFFDGLYEGAEDRDEATIVDIKNAFKFGCQAVRVETHHKQGDKTILDALIPATQAIVDCQGDEEEIFNVAAKAAMEGAMSTKHMIPTDGTASIGTPDVQALAMAYFFKGLSEY